MISPFLDSNDYKADENKEIKVTTTNITEEKDSEFALNDFEAGGNFIDDDFGLSLQQESEHIRQQQLLIEQEVSLFHRFSTYYELLSYINFNQNYFMFRIDIVF